MLGQYDMYMSDLCDVFGTAQVSCTKPVFKSSYPTDSCNTSPLLFPCNICLEQNLTDKHSVFMF